MEIIEVVPIMDKGEDKEVRCVNPDCKRKLNRYHKVNNKLGLCHACEEKRAKHDWDEERLEKWRRFAKFEPIVKEIPADC
jgi:hypothetical protein